MRFVTGKDRMLGLFGLLSVLVLGPVMWHMVSEALVDIIVRVPSGREECLRWVSHLREAGFRVQVETDPSPQLTRKHLNVPDQLAACHTALTLRPSRYVIEGHVPADVIRRLLAEQPTIAGLSVPGTPVGAPGVSGPHPVSFDVWAYGSDGRAVQYAHHVSVGSKVERLREESSR